MSGLVLTTDPRVQLREWHKFRYVGMTLREVTGIITEAGIPLYAVTLDGEFARIRRDYRFTKAWDAFDHGRVSQEGRTHGE